MRNQKPLNVGLVGCGFMGRTHSNAFGKVNQFFDLDRRPVLRAVCGRNESDLNTGSASSPTFCRCAACWIGASVSALRPQLARPAHLWWEITESAGPSPLA